MALRNGIRAAVVAAGLLAIAVTPVAAKPMLSVTIYEDAPCHFYVTYSWSNMGHGTDLTARLQLLSLQGLTITPLSMSSTSPVSGQSGQATETFTSTQALSSLYKAHAYLESSRGTVIAKTDTYSDYAASTPETCS
ncbi:MAG TPA: hypothetical protein VHR16_06315 [Candidatus Limnocylindrales bacterium]|jgi:hypothetical protein|nr:hypothetical protein [Candidatus Limnocylindrales bacterium]